MTTRAFQRILAATGLVVLSVGAFAGAAIADSPSDARAVFHGGNINACPSGEPALVVVGNNASTVQNGITVTDSSPGGIDMIDVALPAGTVLTGHIYVKGGNGYNAYPGSVLTNLIPPFNNGGNHPTISHYLICGTLGELGSLQVTKTVSGSGAGSGGPFPVSVDCGDGPTTLSLVPGTPQAIDGIPDGTECTVTETDAHGADATSYTVGNTTSSAPPTVTITGGETTDVTVANTYAPGSIAVTKVVTGGGDGSGGPFTVDVDCGDGPTTLTLSPNETESVTGLADGTECTVTETGSSGADGTTYAVNAAPSSGTPPTVTVHHGQKTAVTVTNSYESRTGSLVVTKVVDGTGSGSAGPFTVTVTCGESNPVLLTVQPGSSQSITGLAGGTTCGVTETGASGATGTTYTFADQDPSTTPPTVQVAAGETTGVTVTNTYAPATVHVSKTVTGSGAGSDGPFPVSVVCGNTTTTLSIQPGGSQNVTGVPGGTACTVTETSPNGATSTTYQVGETSSDEPVTVTPTAGQTANVTIHNEYAPGAIRVSKVVLGSGPGSAGPFGVEITCGESVTGMVLAPGGSDVLDGIPGGTECSVAESDASGATTTTYTVGDGDPGAQQPSLTVGAGQTTDVTVTNTYLGDLSLTKAVDKTEAGYGDQLTYTLTVAASGQADQAAVVVTDQVPDGTTFDSASCDSPCTATPPSGAGPVTWNVGALPVGTSVDLTLVVTITEQTPDADGGIPAETIVNSGIATSTGDPGGQPSNEVRTGVTAVLGVKIVRPPVTLPSTGLPVWPLLLTGSGLVVVGSVLNQARRRTGH